MASRRSAHNQTGVDDESMDIQVPEQVEEASEERPAFLEGTTFKSPEDMRKSYDEAQATTQRALQRAAEAERNLQEMLEAQQEYEQQQQMQPQQYDQGAWEDAYAQNPIAVMNLIAQTAAQQAADQTRRSMQEQMGTQQQAQNELMALTAEQALAGRYDDWDSYKGRVAQVIQDEPDMFPEGAFSSPERTAAILDRVYRMVKADDIMAGQQQQAQAQANGRLAKLQAQTQSGALGRPEPSGRELADLVKESIRNATPPYGYPQQ